MVWFAMYVGLESKLFSRSMHWFDTASYYDYMRGIYKNFSRWQWCNPYDGPVTMHVRNRDRAPAITLLASHYKLYKLEQEISVLYVSLNKIAAKSSIRYSGLNCEPTISDDDAKARRDIINVMFGKHTPTFYFRGTLKFLCPYDIFEIKNISEKIKDICSNVNVPDFGPRVCKILIKCWCPHLDIENYYPFVKYIEIVKLYRNGL